MEEDEVFKRITGLNERDFLKVLSNKFYLDANFVGLNYYTENPGFQFLKKDGLDLFS